MQLTSQPDLARSGAALAAPSEWNLELPMLLGHQLAMAQIQIGREGKGKSDGKDKSWRLRFALNFSVLGEVGAQVAMVGTRASVAIWADEPATADALEAMLPELAPALTAKGLELISLTVRRGVPRDEALPAGRLMDSLR
ncbi:MAG: flagellar hook-length control protein FliK [Hyphomicrobiales bacterium]|nr:MAG: flagellar hook-length control protein FliK [Hyphomicrobiales bacterium]